jgi:hypothetical protein
MCGLTIRLQARPGLRLCLQPNIVAPACLSRAVSLLTGMQVARIIPRNCKIPDRAAGYIFFVLKWPDGTLTDGYTYNIETAIRMFTSRLSEISAAEREQASARFEVQTRKTRGGLKRSKLATWTATQPLAAFFAAARQAWKRLPKEYDHGGFRRPKKTVVENIPDEKFKG